jgi:hypothetical protein
LTTKSPTGEGESRPARAWYRSKFVRVGAVLIGAAILLAVILLKVYWPFSQREVSQSFQETFPGKLTITYFHSHWFPHPGCVAAGVTFLPRAASGDSGTVITAQRVRIRARYLDILLRPGHVAAVVIEGLRIQVPAVGNGAALENPSPTKVVLDEVIADGAVLEVARRGDPTLKFPINLLRLYSVRHAGAFAYQAALHTPLPPGEVHSKGTFGPWNESAPSKTPAQGSYSYEHADLGAFDGVAGELSSQGDFQGKLEQLQASGTIEIPNFEVTRSHHRVRLSSQYQAVVNAMNGDVALSRVDTTVLKTRALASGSVAGRAGVSGKIVSIDVNVKEGRIQDLLRVFANTPKPALNGVTSFRAHVTVPPGDAPFLKRVMLSGDFGVAAGKFTTPETQTSIAELSERGAGKKPDPEDADPDDLVSELSGHVELKNAVATFTDFRFTVPDAHTNMHGTYNLLTEKVDLHGTLSTTAKFSQTTGGGFKSVILKPFDAIFKRKHHSGGKVPVKLTGTYSHPEPGLEIIK